MNGRMENEVKTEAKILDMLTDMPEVVGEWFIYLKASDNTMNTCKKYITTIRNFLDSIGGIKEISYQSVAKYYVDIKTKTCKNGDVVKTSDSYQSVVWSCINNFLEFLVDRGHIKENYIAHVKKPKNHDLDRINKNRVLLTDNDFMKIIKAVNNGVGNTYARKEQARMKNRDKLIIVLFMTTGMRKTALTEINVSDIDYDNRIISVTDKGDKVHHYSLTDDMVKYLNSWMCDRKKYASETDALFVSKYGNRITGNSVDNLVRKYSKEALGYAISPHKLRAGFCSILYEASGDIEFVRRAVGHSNVSTTQRYVVTNNKEKEKASQIMNSFITA